MSEQQMEQNGRGCMVAFGILSIFAGMAAIGSPFLTGALVTTIIGISLIVGGVMELLVAFSASGWKKGVWAFLGGLLAIVAGALVIAHPVMGAAMIGMILIVFFLMDGITRSILAFQLKPLSGLWAIGVLIGIRILFAGFGILFLTSAAAAAEKAVEA